LPSTPWTLNKISFWSDTTAPTTSISPRAGRPCAACLKYHGKPGSGLSVEFKIRECFVTMLGVTQELDGRFKFVMAEGDSVCGPIPPTGNTNTRGYFKPDALTFFKAWVAEGPTHHFAPGHRTPRRDVEANRRGPGNRIGYREEVAGIGFGEA
jgi:L-arabinose isomerase